MSNTIFLALKHIKTLKQSIKKIFKSISFTLRLILHLSRKVTIKSLHLVVKLFNKILMAYLNYAPINTFLVDLKKQFNIHKTQKSTYTHKKIHDLHC